MILYRARVAEHQSLRIFSALFANMTFSAQRFVEVESQLITAQLLGILMSSSRYYLHVLNSMGVLCVFIDLAMRECVELDTLSTCHTIRAHTLPTKRPREHQAMCAMMNTPLPLRTIEESSPNDTSDRGVRCQDSQRLQQS